MSRRRSTVVPHAEVWPGYATEVQHGPRTRLQAGDHVRVAARKAGCHGFQGRFRFAFTDGDGTLTYCVSEDEGNRVARVRYVKPVRVRSTPRRGK